MAKSRVTAKTILRKAYRLLTKQSNWVKGSYNTVRNGVPCFCAKGAISQVATGSAYNDNDLSRVATDYLSETVGRNVEDWNDAPETTHRVVLKAFRKAYALAGGSRP